MIELKILVSLAFTAAYGLLFYLIASTLFEEMNIQNLRRKLHTHKWKTTKENRWCLPTEQVCKCGITRTVQTYPGPKLQFRWEYSTGAQGPWRSMATGEKIVPKSKEPV